MNPDIQFSDFETDAVFLPGKIHGCADEVYIIYCNTDSEIGATWEIEILDKRRILELYERVDGNSDDFFAKLPDWFQDEWEYCDFGTRDFDEYIDCYSDADFILGRDGDRYDEMMFLVSWAESSDKVNKFINHFHKVSPTGNITQVFTRGCCYWFAHILCSRFEEARMMYDSVRNHFVAEINHRLYDITGDVTGLYNVVSWHEFDDELQKPRIISYCVDFME